MAKTAYYYLSANCGDGCRSLAGILARESLYDLMLLRGGPGTGKDLFLRQVGQAMEDAGAAVEYFSDPTDPEELQGLLLPELRCAVVDGGPEPRYPGAVERWIDLGRFLDVTAAKAARDEIIRRTDRAAAAEARAFHALKAACQLTMDSAVAARLSVDQERLERRFRGVMGRELRRRGSEAGRTVFRFLESATCRGQVIRFDTVEALCPKVYELEDSFGIAGPYLERLCAAAAERGWDTVACLSPEEPGQMEHLLVPGLGLAFVTSRPEARYPGSRHRRLRLDAMAGLENRGRLRFENRLAGQLRQEAAASLALAREERRGLEALCRPYVDLDAVAMLAAVESSRLLFLKEK